MSRYTKLTRDELAVLVPELLLVGHLIDRSGMVWCIESFGREEMLQIAIEEWAAASPIYTRRMQRALGYEGTDVITIFKGLQLDIGAPPQFMDFRYQIQDPNHGTFHLDHCGALLDVEPMGADYVTGMCHDIEDPTFDATAVATNSKARMRPVHRPPRTPADRHPHCAWAVFIDEDLPDLQPFEGQADIQLTEAAKLELLAIDPDDPGQSDYAGVLVSDLDFAGFSHSALIRLADEVVLQMHLLNLGFRRAVRLRAAGDETVFDRVTRKQVIGHAGVAAERLYRALSLPATPEGAARLLELHPVFNPAGYVQLRRDGATVTVEDSLAHRDGAWIGDCSPDRPEVLQAVVRAMDPHFDVEISGTGTRWTARVIQTEQAAEPAPEVQVTKFSKGASFEFEPRRSLPLTVL
jgi:hypothetical protein